jgi:hypothetical protein
MSGLAWVLASSRRRLRAVVLALWVAPVLFFHGCGGGIWLGFGDGFDDFPPTVTLASAVTSVQAGQTLRLVAAAADENGIESVAFLRIEGSGSVLLDRDFSAPYEVVTAAPTDGRTSMSVFARATDNQGRQADSAVVTIAITP